MSPAAYNIYIHLQTAVLKNSNLKIGLIKVTHLLQKYPSIPDNSDQKSISKTGNFFDKKLSWV